MIEITVQDKTIYPPQVRALLKKTQKALRASCQEIGFPPQMVGLE